MPSGFDLFPTFASKHERLREHGLDLGAAVGTVQQLPGGSVQVYERGRIYHHGPGFFEVHGLLLEEFERLGGLARFGFPIADQARTPDDIAEMSAFELGDVEWGFGGGAVGSWGDMRPRRYGPALGHAVGAQVTGRFGSRVVPCEFGMLVALCGDAPREFSYGGPMLGHPAVVGLDGRTPTIPIGADPPPRVDDSVGVGTGSDLGNAFPVATNLLAWCSGVVSKAAWERIEHIPGFWAELLADRVGLWSVGVQRSWVPVRVVAWRYYPVDAGVAVDLALALPAGATLADRTLYDIAYREPGQPPCPMAVHSVYARRGWKRWAAMHATDLHVNARSDRHARTLDGTPSGPLHNNFNDAVRDAIRYANRLHERGLLDLVICTGDLIDFGYEPGDDQQHSLGNGLFFERMLRGWTQPGDEELRMPIFTVLGNHDYRRQHYELDFFSKPPSGASTGALLAAGLIGLQTELVIAYLVGRFSHQQQFSSRNMTAEDALAVQGGHSLQVGMIAALDMVRDVGIPPHYALRVTRGAIGDNGPSYVVALGPHRLVMLDSGYDQDVFDSIVDPVIAKLGLANEDRLSLAGGAPNLQGVSQRHLDLVARALSEAGDEGVVVVGIHGPPVNFAEGMRADHFRETQHPTASERDVLGSLVLPEQPAYATQGSPWTGGGTPDAHAPWPAGYQVDWDRAPQVAARSHPGWVASLGRPWFMEGTVADLLDRDGASKGHADELLRLCAGLRVGGHAPARRADLVLCGHGHRNVELRVAPADRPDALRFFFDFYTETPPGGVYYATTKVVGDALPAPAHVRVQDGAAPNGAPQEVHDHQWDVSTPVVVVPPYADPLDASADRRAWWQRHRPLVIQSAATGPTESNDRPAPDKRRPGPAFQGVRVLAVAEGTIHAIHVATTRDIRASNFRLGWEDSLLPPLHEGPGGRYPRFGGAGEVVA